MSELSEEPDAIEMDRHAILEPHSRMICYFKGLERWPVLLTVRADGRLPIGGDRPLPIDLITTAKLVVQSAEKAGGGDE